jgi:hypothetical protein
METRNKVLIGFGIILLIIGLVASFYQERTHYVSHGDLINAGETVTPYRDVGIVLAVAGIVFIALGFLNLSRRGFLVVGLVLLILSFFFFYWASRVNWDYVSTYEETVNVGYPTYVNNYDDYVYPVNLPTIEMQSGDYLTVECSQFAPEKSSFIILFERTPFGMVTPTEVGIYPDFLSYTNLDTTEVMSVDIGIPSNQNVTSTTVSVTLNLNHYETPQWAYFGIGVVLCSLAMIPIFKSKK